MKLYIILLCYNLLVFFIYGTDKLFAIKKLRRISEKTLLLFSFFMGGIGAMFGMTVFCHKTRKMKFRLLVPMFVIMNVVLIVYAIKKGYMVI